jgi:hypothetical protein
MFGDVRDLFRGSGRPANRALPAMGVLVVIAGIALRFYAPTALWLDEVISVNISKLPLSQIPTALSHDGAPPLYYVLLHFWMDLFGEGDVSVRALSGVISVGTLPFFWYAGRRLGGRTVAWVTFFLGVTSPFAIYYATCTRMYSLMVLWAVLGFLALVRALERPTTGRLVALGAVTGAVLYTHYWGLYLIFVSGIWLLYQLWRHRQGLPTTTDRSSVARCFMAMVLGSLSFLPWAPVLVFQTFHTGTPWTSAAGPADLLNVFGDYSGSGPWAELLAYAYFGLIILGVFGRRLHLQRGLTAAGGAAARSVAETPIAAAPDAATFGSAAAAPPAGAPAPGAADGPPAVDEHLVEAIDGTPERHGPRAGLLAGLDRAIGVAGFGPGGAGASARRREPGRGIVLVLQPNRRALPIFGVLLGTLVVAVVAGAGAQAAFVARYAAVVLPLFLLLVALGVGVLSERRVIAGTLGVLCVAGLFTGLGNNSAPRTQAVQVAQVLNAEAQPGDLVVFCPDQLGPAVNRLITVPNVTQLTFPRAIGPQRVNWVDYKQTIARTNPETFAQDMVADAGAGHTIWLVWRDGYPGLGGDCGDLASWLGLLQGQGTTVLHANSSYYEYENLTRYPTT